MNHLSVQLAHDYVKSRRQVGTSVVPLKRMGGLVSDSKDKLQLQVAQFKSAFTKDTGDTHLPNTTKKCRTSIPPLSSTQWGMRNFLETPTPLKLKELKTAKAQLLKTFACQLAPARYQPSSKHLLNEQNFLVTRKTLSCRLFLRTAMYIKSINTDIFP